MEVSGLAGTMAYTTCVAHPRPDSSRKLYSMTEPFTRRIDARLILSVIACGIMSFSGVVVETAMNITFPSLMSEFGVDTATVQWVTTGYLLVLTAIMPLSSFLKRRFRNKTLFAAAICCFAAGTIACAIAPTFSLLIVGRLVQGVGTGLALPLMFNIVIEQAPHDKMGLMMGIATLITATAPAVGPSVGGLIVTLWGWRQIFVVLLPFLACSAIAGLTSLRQVSETEHVSFSVPQFLVLSGSFVCLVFASSCASSAGWLSAQVAGLLAAGVALIAAFAALSRRDPNPLIRIDIFRSRSFAASVAYVVLLQAIVLGLGYLLPYYGQVVNGQDEFGAGCLLLPGCIVGAILAPLGGRILDVFGAKRPLAFGSICQLAAVVLYATVSIGAAPWAFSLIYVLIPLSQGFSAANSVTNGLSYLPTNRKTDGNAAFNTLQQLGGALGTAVMTSIVNAAQSTSGDLVAGTVAGTQTSFYVLAGLSIAALCATAAVFVGRGRKNEGAR